MSPNLMAKSPTNTIFDLYPLFDICHPDASYHG